MEEFIENVKFLINILGHRVFDEKREVKSPEKQDLVILNIKAARCADAIGEPTSDGFVVLKGSKNADSTVPSMTPNFLKLRKELIENGTIIINSGIFEHFEDYIFTSPSTAAVIVIGRNANGLTEWKLKDGKELKAFELDKKQS